jgi:Rab proteins geranylgeranyltransferase component A
LLTFLGYIPQFSNPALWKREVAEVDDAARLGPSRAYTLALRPQIIYAKSDFLTALVSSKIAPQLEFVAVGPSWVLGQGGLRKIPSTREAVFNDDSLSMRDKRSLMKLLRHVLQDETDRISDVTTQPEETLEQLLQRFRIPSSLHSAVQALALTTVSIGRTDSQASLRRIQRHLQSIGHLGPGFGAVIAKYGSNPEIAQVACRAQAVGGGIYLLGHGIASLDSIPRAETSVSGDDELLRRLELTDGIKIRTRRVVAGEGDMPSNGQPPTRGSIQTLHSISIISRPLKPLLAPESDASPTPAAAIVLVESQHGPAANPIYLQIHSEDTGECPVGQCEFSLLSFFGPMMNHVILIYIA